jgi:hypothetical protein
MMKQLCLVAILAGALAVGSAQAWQVQDAAPVDEATAQAQQAGPAGTVQLGTVRVPRNVMADGQPLRAGTYQLRLTEQTPEPAPGQTPGLLRWVEFIQGGQVRARALANIVPQAEIREIAQTTPPGAGSSRVEMLKGDDYLRIWVHRGGYHYLMHLPPQ